MKRIAFVLLICLAGMVIAEMATADEYVDDLYFNPQTQIDMQAKAGTLQPQYNKQKMQELVFVTDSTYADKLDKPSAMTSTDTLTVIH